MGAKKLMSVEEFDRLQEPDELSYELDEGELVVMTKPRPLHNRIVGNLYFELRGYLKAHPVGEVFNSENLFILGRNTKRAVEVVSPSDTVTGMRRKIRQYFDAGAKCVWVVYPETHEVEVWSEAARPQIILQENDLLEAPDLLPDFSLRIAALFG